MINSATGGLSREISDEEIYRLQQEENRKRLARQEQLLSGQAVPLPQEDVFVQSNKIQVTPESGKSWLDSFEETLLEIPRSLGLTARTGLNALSSSPVGLATDIIAGGINLALPEKYEIPYTREGFAQLGDITGLPQPTESEKPLMTIGEMAGGAGLFRKGAQDLATALAPKPMEQIKNISLARDVTGRLAKDVGDFGIVPTIASGAGGGAGLAMAEDAQASPAEAMLASIFGSSVAMIPQMAQQQLRVLLTGARTPERLAQAQSAIAYWKQVIGDKAKIPVSAVTGSKMARGAEQLASQTLGGRTIMAQNAEDINTAVAMKVDELAGTLGNVNKTGAGNEIVRGAESFKIDFKGKKGDLYNEADPFIPKNHTVNPTGSIAYAEEIITPIELIRGQQSPINSSSEQIQTIAKAINKTAIDMAKQGKSGFDYEGMKQLRSKVGDLLGEAKFNRSPDEQQLARLYAVLSEDITRSFANNPKALSKLKRADRYFQAGMKRLDNIATVIDREGGENVFRLFLAGSKDGATRVSAIMRSLPPESRKIVASAVLRKLGMANKSQVAGEEVGDVFSINTFLTEYEKLSPEAKRIIFSNADFPKSFDSDLKAIVSVARDVRKGGNYLANPSGTGGVVSAVTYGTQAGSALGGLIYSLSTGGGLAPVALGVGGAVVPPILSNRIAKFMTNPDFVRWLASGSKIPNTPKATSAWLSQLKAIKDKSPELAEANELLQAEYKKGLETQMQPQEWEVGVAEELTE